VEERWQIPRWGTYDGNDTTGLVRLYTPQYDDHDDDDNDDRGDDKAYNEKVGYRNPLKLRYQKNKTVELLSENEFANSKINVSTTVAYRVCRENWMIRILYFLKLVRIKRYGREQRRGDQGADGKHPFPSPRSSNFGPIIHHHHARRRFR